MATDPVFFRDLAYVFLAALLGGCVAWLARQPLILGYVIGGILISPLTPGPAVERVHSFELFAEIGVVLLMFSIGIEFSLRDLLRVKWVALLGGPLGIVLSVGLALAVGAVLGWPPLYGHRHRPRRLRGEHHGPGPAADRPGGAALAPRPRHDRHHAGRGPRVVALTVLIPALGDLRAWPTGRHRVGGREGPRDPAARSATSPRRSFPPLMTRVARTPQRRAVPARRAGGRARARPP